MKTLQGVCEHEVKVNLHRTSGAYCVQVYLNGELNQEGYAADKTCIGPVARAMLRMEDKCGNLSDFAKSARTRHNEDWRVQWTSIDS